MEEPMSKEKMQRYLIQQVRDGKSELEAYRGLMEVLGVDFPELERVL